MSETAVNIPGYEVIGDKPIGQGGMSTVYLAIRESLNQRVALKVMSPALAADPKFGERFEREGKTVGRLDHLGILKILDIGVSNHQHYMALEYAAGGDLKQLIRKGAIPPERCFSIIEKIANALAFAHSEGFIHRDVKPENILFRQDGFPVLSDFGIAKAVGSAGGLTGTGMIIGSPHYMSPEQAKGETVDHRSDIYSLGVVLYEMLTGNVPYDAENSVAVTYAHVHNEIPDLPDHLSEYQGFMNCLLAKSPNDRFACADDMVSALKNLVKSSVPQVQINLVDSKENTNQKEQGQNNFEKSETEIIASGKSLKDGSSGTRIIPETSGDRSHSGTTVLHKPEEAEPSRSYLPKLVASIAVFFVIGGLIIVFTGSKGDSDVPLEKLVVQDEPKIDIDQNKVADDEVDEVVDDEVDESPTDGMQATSDKGNNEDITFSKEERIASLLDMARNDIANLRLTSGPKGKNAYDRYQEVLKLDPENKRAQEGLLNVGNKYLELFDLRLSQNKIEKAERYLVKAESILGSGKKEIIEREKQLVEVKQNIKKKETLSKDVLGDADIATEKKASTTTIIESYDVLIARGQAALIKKDKEAALLSCRKALTVKPNDPFAQECIDQATLKYKGGEIFFDKLRNGLKGPELVVIPKGSFKMGDVQSIGADDERPVHKVFIAKPFAIGKTEITLRQYDMFCKSTKRPLINANGSGKRENLPVINVSWLDANAFVRWLSKETGEIYRLPSEAEWEYAARGGKETSYWWGTSLGNNNANCDGCGSNWDKTETAPVASFKPNAYKLYDVTGNVWEWCSDSYHKSYVGAPQDGSAWTGSGSEKIYRGGSYLDSGDSLRISFRNYGNKSYKNKDLGFRVVREL